MELDCHRKGNVIVAVLVINVLMFIFLSRSVTNRVQGEEQVFFSTLRQTAHVGSAPSPFTLVEHHCGHRKKHICTITWDREDSAVNLDAIEITAWKEVMLGEKAGFRFSKKRRIPGDSDHMSLKLAHGKYVFEVGAVTVDGQITKVTRSVRSGTSSRA